MSHITCPKCGSTEHTYGYGLAAGPMGSYTYCDGCYELIEFAPDTEGLDEAHAMRLLEQAEEHMRSVWGKPKDGK